MITKQFDVTMGSKNYADYIDYASAYILFSKKGI